MRRSIVSSAFGALVALPVALAGCGAPPAAASGPPSAPGATSTVGSAGTVGERATAPSAQSPAGAPPVADDEGMWLLNDFPSARVAALHGFAPTKAWLDHVRLASVRLADGCSGSFVSPTGLVMTNHHCAHDCIEQLSTAKKDYVASGFTARAEKDEVRCPGLEINQLVGIDDVTARIDAATKGKEGAAFNDAQKGEMSSIEKACATSDELRCEVIPLYQGGRHHLYKYARFQDVRLVFAPEFGIAFFGGDPDNFMFPRYDLDVTFLRVYRDGKPVATPEHFAWGRAAVKPGDLTFVPGTPWSTSRELTVAQLEYLRDTELPDEALRLAELRGALGQFQRLGKEQERVSNAARFFVENDVKGIVGRLEALRDKDLMGRKAAVERELRARAAADPALRADVSGAWDAIAAATERARELHAAHAMVEGGGGFVSTLFGHARTLVRVGEELSKPNEARLRELVDARLPEVREGLVAPAPIDAQLETLRLTLSLQQLRERLGADDVLVRKVLGKDTPQDLALRVVRGTKLFDPKVRKALLEGGKAAILASKDPMIALARLVDPDARAIRKRWEDEVEGPVKKNAERIARAKFAIWGTSVYPDATATLRLSFGEVKGWDQNGKAVSPVTTLGGAFDHATGKDPFALPQSWLDARARLSPATPFDFATTNDIIGGNSGSPVIDRNAEIVGLVFDGNIHSLGGDYAYEPKNNRAVAVTGAALAEALEKVYRADRVLGDLGLRR